MIRYISQINIDRNELKKKLKESIRQKTKNILSIRNFI